MKAASRNERVLYFSYKVSFFILDFIINNSSNGKKLNGIQLVPNNKPFFANIEDVVDINYIIYNNSNKVNNGIISTDNGFKIECLKSKDGRRFYVHLSNIKENKGVEVFWIFQFKYMFGYPYLKRIIKEG